MESKKHNRHISWFYLNSLLSEAKLDWQISWGSPLSCQQENKNRPLSRDDQSFTAKDERKQLWALGLDAEITKTVAKKPTNWKLT